MHIEKISTEKDFNDEKHPVEPDQDETQRELPNRKISRIKIDDSSENDVEKPHDDNSVSRIINHDIPDQDA